MFGEFANSKTQLGHLGDTHSSNVIEGLVTFTVNICICDTQNPD